MSDEEDGENSFKRKRPKDRSEELNNLIEKLNQRHEEKLWKGERIVPKVSRVVSESSSKDFSSVYLRINSRNIFSFFNICYLF